VQQIEKVSSELVQTNNEGYKSVAYDKLSAVLVEAIKDQNAKIKKLQKLVDKYENIEWRLEALEKGKQYATNN